MSRTTRKGKVTSANCFNVDWLPLWAINSDIARLDSPKPRKVGAILRSSTNRYGISELVGWDGLNLKTGGKSRTQKRLRASAKRSLKMF